MATATGYDEQLRAAAFAYLDLLRSWSGEGALRSAEVNRFTFGGEPLPLIVQAGIWKPARLDAALSIRTTYTRPTQEPPYVDALGEDGLLRYKYRGTDAQQSDNRALRAAMERGVPLVYFVGVAPGRYVARYPVWIVDEDTGRHDFAVAVDEAQRYLDLSAVPETERAYLRRLTLARLHQPVFRARVLDAYAGTCAMCRLRHPELLDAAHILPDSHPRGVPVVPNGLSLCKLHHAAYDHDVLGVRPDLVVEVSHRVLEEVDGPMLRHGLQGMAGVTLLVPRSRSLHPDPDRLGERYAQFRAAG